MLVSCLKLMGHIAQRTFIIPIFFGISMLIDEVYFRNGILQASIFTMFTQSNITLSVF